MKIILILLTVTLLSGCTLRPEEHKTVDIPLDKVEKSIEVEKPKEEEEATEEMSMEKEAEANAEKYPAKPGASLVTKGGNDFTGTNYYFKGEIIEFTEIENNVGDPSTWLVKNENGYVMPIQHDFFEAEKGNVVEVWGTLTGNGYANLEGVENVVGETGSMHALIVSVNGERQY